MNDETKPAKTKPAKTKPAKTKRAKTKRAKTKPADLWERTKAWADKNRTISGALLGGAAGTIVPGIGTVIGAIVGAGIGFASLKEKKRHAHTRSNNSSAPQPVAKIAAPSSWQ
jgi:phage tail tape-measure protein